MLDYNFVTNLVLVIIPAHIFVLVIVIDSQLFASMCLFDGNLGTWNGKPYDIKLKPYAEPYHQKPFLFH